ncbi:TK1 [Carcinus maenas nudivirus]|uniref:TK1 n=1 Tax=Carcinus maenas nudivirus TaxID=2880837 RepID=A0AAE8Y2C3_9VIRU|nr:TK1 [Carcinus maenas nudivirus]UBZ25644.1 TK1 [Carcinus maenas nudivirus]
MINNILSKLDTHKYERCNDRMPNFVLKSKDLIWVDLDSKPIREFLAEEKPMLKFNLEDYMNALPKKYLIAYLLAVVFNVFENTWNCAYLYDDRTKLDSECIFVINEISKLLNANKKDNYYIAIKLDHIKQQQPCYIYLPWNDYIMTNLAAVLYDDEMQFANNKIPDYFERDEIKDIVTKLVKKDRQFITSLKAPEICEHFLNNTDDIAVSINGTACVGKTKLLQEIQHEVIKRYDPSCQILKIGKYGGFKGKDSNQILSLTYQGIALNLVNRQPTSIMDRDPFNNLIWRCILQCMKTFDRDEDLIDLFVEIFVTSVSRNLVKTMQQYPVVVLVDFDEIQNRMRMFNRATGGDRKRCFITNYVKIQNIVYCTFAHLANWPVFETAFNSIENPENRFTIKNLILTKISQNTKNNKRSMPELESNSSFKSDFCECFNTAKKLKIMK